MAELRYERGRILDEKLSLLLDGEEDPTPAFGEA
jgi:hypothetical protein